MKYFMVLAVFLCLVIQSQVANANENNVDFILHLNYSVPNGAFGEEIGNNPRITRRFGFDYGRKVGLASAGYGGGIEVNQPVLNSHLNWAISVGFYSNPVNNSTVTAEFNKQLDDSVRFELDQGNWVNIPIMTGFTYYADVFENFRIYATLQGGLNITGQPYRKATIEDQLVEETTFRVTPDFGFQAGIGVQILNRYHVSIRYFDLGNPRYDGTRILNESFFQSIPKRKMNVDGDERSISMFQLFIGYSL